MKKIFVLFTLAALLSFGYAESVKKDLPSSWQNCTLDGLSYSSPFAYMTAGEIFDETNLITKEDVKTGGTFGVLTGYKVMPEFEAAIFAYELKTVANKAGIEGQINKIADILVTIMFSPEDGYAIVYELEVLQASTGMTKTFTYDNYIYDSKIMAGALEPFLKMMVKSE